MPHNQSNKADKPIYCIACGKVIGQGYIVAGSIQLLCKCGVKTKIEAENKPEGRSGRNVIDIPVDKGSYGRVGR
jgi:hypothetical protein